MERILIGALPQHVGETVKLCGWVHIRRDHGKLIFIELRDRSGKVQLVILPEKNQSLSSAKDIRSEFALEVTGLVKARPAKAGAVAPLLQTVEIEVESLQVVGKPDKELPIDVSQPELDLNLETLLNLRTLALRNDKVRAIFEIYSEMLLAYDTAMREANFVEIKTPKILGAATEGGANVFKIKYFGGEAFLAQSPQFYKQAGMSVFERVFEVGAVFRAEPSYTTRHVSEYTGLDAEMGFIDSVEDVMAQLETTMQALFQHIGATCQKQLSLYGATVPDAVPIPRLRLSDAFAILKKEYGKEYVDEDIDAEGERLISEYVKKTFGSDLVFLTHYPTAIRAFYSMPSAENPKYSETFDLLFRGLEIASGGQRVHDPRMLEEIIRKRGMNPDDFTHYLDIFRYGTPPHGGWGLGSERIVQKILGLQSIKEAVLYPRDVKRLTP